MVIYKDAEIHIYRGGRFQVFGQEEVSLHGFQEAFGIRHVFEPVSRLIH